jgi:hypothetical protein
MFGHSFISGLRLDGFASLVLFPTPMRDQLGDPGCRAASIATASAR